MKYPGESQSDQGQWEKYARASDIHIRSNLVKALCMWLITNILDREWGLIKKNLRKHI